MSSRSDVLQDDQKFALMKVFFVPVILVIEMVFIFITTLACDGQLVNKIIWGDKEIQWLK